jgi:mRNA interferase YafQ
MYQIVRTSRFKRDVKKALKRHKDIEKLKKVIKKLVKGQTLSEKYQDHPLQGDYKDCRDCHIEGDWILIYRIKGDELHLIRTGTHADLFR